MHCSESDNSMTVQLSSEFPVLITGTSKPKHENIKSAL
jgi:hypothetical protein